MPRSWLTGSDPAKTAPRQFQAPTEEHQNGPQTVTVQIESKDLSQKEQKNSKSMTKTYHTIRDMISSKFKSNKDSTDEKLEETGLNNVADELRKSQSNIVEEQEKKTGGEQGIYGKPRVDPTLAHQHQYNQHFVQQHLLAQQAQQQFQVTQQLKAQQQYSQQLVQARSQEILTPQDDQMYYHNYGVAPQRPPVLSRFPQAQQREQNYVQMQSHHQVRKFNY